MSNSEPRRRPLVGPKSSTRGLRALLVLAALAALAVVLIPTGSASVTTIKVYDLQLGSTGSGCSTPGDSCLPGATLATMTLNITNDQASNTTLGSVNFDAPSALPIDTSVAHSPTTTAGNVQLTAKSGTGGELQIRNLNLAPNSSATVTYYVDSPCSGSGLSWSAFAKQSNNFNGSGNDFTLNNSGSAGLTSDIAPGGCHVGFYNQPTDTKVGGTITDVAGSAGAPIKVGLYNSSNQLLQSCPVQSCTASISASTGSPDAGSLSGGGAVAFAYDAGEGGLIASFGSLSITGVTHFPESFTLTASGLNTSATSQPFNIVNYTADCSSGSCTLGSLDNPANLGGGGGAVFITTSTGFTFLELNPSDPLTSTPAGCQSFIGTGAEGLVETDGRTDPNASMTVTYYVPQKLIQARYGKNVGQQFIPICAGLKQVVTNSVTGAVSAQSCSPAGDTSQGWLGDELSGGLFDGNPNGPVPAVCGSDGYYWGILPSFQDKVPPGGPVVTGWNSITIGGTAYRYFVITVPPGWDMIGHG